MCFLQKKLGLVSMQIALIYLAKNGSSNGEIFTCKNWKKKNIKVEYYIVQFEMPNVHVPNNEKMNLRNT